MSMDTGGLRTAIVTALEHAAPPPANEAATLYRIIDPLLAAMGYSPRDVDPESPISQWQRPDRTILPGSDHEWYLEAKAWGVSLDDDRHLQQATNYAHSRGKRWVVLTNGQVWRIYDDHITGLPPSDRLVAEARLDHLDEIEQLLRAISRDAIVSGSLGQFATRTRVAAYLTRSLKDESSGAIRALWAVVRKEPGLAAVSRRQVASYFQDLQAAIQPEESRPRPLVRPEPRGASSPGSPAPPSDEPRRECTRSFSLSALAASAEAEATGSKPCQVTLPDGSTSPVASWRTLAVEVVRWVAIQGRLPAMPFHAGHRSQLYFLNAEPRHQHKPMRPGYRRVAANGSELYIDLHRSAANILGSLCDVCQSAGLDPGAFSVCLTSALDAGSE